MPTRTLFVRTREGLSLAAIDRGLAERVAALAADEPERGPLLDLAALVVVRAGREAGEALLAHWLDHEPSLLTAADPLLAATLAHEPEVLTGPLATAAFIDDRHAQADSRRLGPR